MNLGCLVLQHPAVAPNALLAASSRAPQVAMTPQWHDQSFAEAADPWGRAAAPEGGPAAGPTKVRIDLSWTYWPPPPPTEEGEEPPEEPALEFNLIMYNKDVSGVVAWCRVRHFGMDDQVFDKDVSVVGMGPAGGARGGEECLGAVRGCEAV